MHKQRLPFYLLQFIIIALGLCVQKNTYAAPSGYSLFVDLSPAICKFDPNQKRSRQCLEGYALTVAGLIPDDVNARQCATSSPVTLSPVQKRLLMRIMPDEIIQARLWRNIGGCIPMNSTQYFRWVVHLSDQLNIPTEITSPTSSILKQDKVIQSFIQQNKGLHRHALQLNCYQRNSTHILTRIRICYDTQGRYKTCPTPPIRACGQKVLIQGIY